MKLLLISLLSLVLFFGAYAMENGAKRNGPKTIQELRQKIAEVKARSEQVNRELDLEMWRVQEQGQQVREEEDRLCLFRCDWDSLRGLFKDQQGDLSRVIGVARSLGLRSQVDPLIVAITDSEEQKNNGKC